MNIGFYLLGPSDNNDASAISIKELEKYKNIVTYLGNTNDVRPFIAKSSCIVLPSYYKEGIPRSLLEAMALGKPIITTDTSGCKDLIKLNIKQNNQKCLKGLNGFLIKPKDIEALKLAINECITSTDINSMGKNALEIIKQYNINLINKIYLNKINLYKGTKILFVSNTSFGMFNFRFNTLLEIQNAGYEIHIIAPFDNTTIKLKNAGFKCYDIYINKRGINPIQDLKLLISLRSLYKYIKPNLVFNYTIKPAIYSTFIANLYKIKNISIITGLGYVFIRDGLYKKILRAIVIIAYKLSIKYANEVWFLNKDDKEELINLNIIDENKTYILPSEGIDLNYFKVDFKIEKTFKANNKAQQDFLYRKNKNEFIFLLIARMMKDKGITEFIKVANIFHNKNILN